jgi:hypothetical protein
MGLKFGNESLSLPGSLNRYKPQHTLILERQCEQDTFECLSTDEQYALFLQRALAIMEAEMTDLMLNQTNFEEMKTMFGNLSKLLEKSMELYIEEVEPILLSVQLVEDILFGLSFPLTLLEISVLSVMVGSVKKNIQSTRRLLQMIPYEVTARTPDMHKYLKTGKLNLEILDAAKKAKQERKEKEPLWKRIVHLVRAATTEDLDSEEEDVEEEDSSKSVSDQQSATLPDEVNGPDETQAVQPQPRSERRRPSFMLPGDAPPPRRGSLGIVRSMEVLGEASSDDGVAKVLSRRGSVSPSIVVEDEANQDRLTPPKQSLSFSLESGSKDNGNAALSHSKLCLAVSRQSMRNVSWRDVSDNTKSKNADASTSKPSADQNEEMSNDV